MSFYNEYFSPKFVNKKRNATNKYYRFYICALGNKIIGHVWFGQQDNDRSKGFIDELYVRPKYRRKGIATILGKEAIRWIREKNCSAIDVDVKVNNEASIKLCQKMGFSRQQPKWVALSMDLAS
jgi:ribosomal protein S18 acetylase RimI-like enzyme